MNHLHIHPTSSIDENVFVDATALVGPNCHFAGNITIEAGAVLQGSITLIGDIVIGLRSLLEPGVCIAEPKPGQSLGSRVVRVGADVHIGAGSALMMGVAIGNHAWVEPGTIVVRNIPPYAIVGGHPATISGYVGNSIHQLEPLTGVVPHSDVPGVYPCTVQGVTVHHYARIRDLRGDLSIGEFGRNVPFQPKRYFIVYDVPSAETRGEHAHKTCNQFLICVAGTVSVVVDDGAHREEVLLDRPNIGLLIPAGVWGIQYKYSASGTLLVFASEYYDASDYIRNYDEFLKFRGLGT